MIAGMWTDDGFRHVLGADPKPPARIKADQNDWLRLRKAKLTFCRICGDGSPLTLHHLVSRSLGGDDVAENLCCLCGSGTTGCHGLVEARNEWACSLLGKRLLEDELAYVLRKKGAGFLARYYGVRDAA